MRWAGLVLAVALTLTACGDDADDAVPVTTTAPTDDATTTTAEPTTTTATTTFAQADDPPPLVNTGEDFDAIIRSFVAYGSWLTAHPNEERLEEIVRRDGAAWQELQPYIAELESRGRRTDGQNPSRVREVRVLERPGPDLVIAYVVTDNPPYRILEADGSVFDELPAENGVAIAYELRRGGGGEWRIEARTFLGRV